MMSASSCLSPALSYNVQIYTFSSKTIFYARLDEFGPRCGYLVFKKTPASFVDEIAEHISIPKTAQLTYRDETLVLKMGGAVHEIAKSLLTHIVEEALPGSFGAEVMAYGSAAIVTNDWTKQPDASWGTPIRMDDPPEAAKAASSRTLVIEVGSSEPGYKLQESAQRYLDAGIPYVILVDISQVQPRITVQLLEARTHLSRPHASTRTSTIVVERNRVGETVITQRGPIILSVADLARRGYEPGDRSVRITDDDVRYLAQLVWPTQKFP
ncbi:hypothetical protein KEM56_000458 [Ascosphaera pollenicola]|nr:hypothetical protein KEM56_000458 [Ascosphaera pollenicola]